MVFEKVSRLKAKDRLTQRAATVLNVKAVVVFYGVGKRIIRLGKAARHAPWHSGW